MIMDTILNNNKNDNSNSKKEKEDKFEILFWKVIHNKFIFNHIFHLIETIEWVEYKGIGEITIYDRIKFKNIHSLEWMIVNKQYELLKYKFKHHLKLTTSTNIQIASGDNYIEITETGMNRLLQLGNSEKQDQQEEQYETDKSLLLELLPWILDNKKLEIADINIPLLAIENNNLIALQILLNEPYSYQIFPSDLEWSIKHSPHSFVNELIKLSTTNNNVIISEEFKNNSIVWAFENRDHRDEMLKLVLDNPQLYSPPLSPSSKLNTRSLFIIKSSEIQNKLLDLNYIKQVESTLLPKSNDLPERISNSISKILETKNDGTITDRSKELHKLFAIEFQCWSKSYLLKYDDPVKGLDLMALISHSLSTYSVKTLLYIIENEYSNIKEYHLMTINLQDNSKSVPTIKPTTEFIKLYFKNIGMLNSKPCNERIDKYILEIGSTDQYETILNEISNNGKYPSKWNSILSSYYKIQQINISDKETIDYLVEHNSNTFIQNLIGKLKADNFNSCEFLEYAIHEFNDNSITVSKLNNLDIFNCALDNCDAESLARVSDNGTIVFNNSNTLKKIGNQPIESLNKLFNNIKSINYKNFIVSLFFPLLELISVGKSLDEINQISIPHSLFDHYQVSIVELVSSISQFQPKKIQLILNSFNPISKLPDQFKECWNNRVTFYHLLYSSNRDIIFLYDKNKKSTLTPIELTEMVIQSIEIILSHYVGEITVSLEVLPSVNIEIYSIIINFLFKCLISIKGIGSSLVFKVLNLVNSINNNKGRNQQIIIEHSYFHSFFYICIKSIKFQKYLVELPNITSILNNYETDSYSGHHSSSYDGYGGYNISKYLDPSIFTFDYIFGSGTSFDDILYKLITHLSILPAINDKEMVNYEGIDCYYSQSLDSDLFFCLEINNPRVFFKLLDQIQQHLNDTTIEIGSSSTITTKIKSFNNSDIGGKNELYQQTITNGRIFQFSQGLFNVACLAFENSEPDFQKFISFCNYYSVLECLSNGESTIINEHFLNHFNQYKSIFNNYYPNIQFFKMYTLHDPKSSNLLQMGSTFGHGITFDHDGLSVNHLIKYQHYFINNPVNNLIEHDKLLVLLQGNKLIKFNLVLRELFSNCLNQGILDYFKITCSTIDVAIEYNQIGYLKYYFENGIINNENQLLQYLKQKISLHKDYKYVNWLK